MPLTDPGLPSAESPRIKWGKLYGAATALILAEAALKASGPLIVVTQSSRDAEQLSEEIAFFAGAGRTNEDDVHGHAPVDVAHQSTELADRGSRPLRRCLPGFSGGQ